MAINHRADAMGCDGELAGRQAEGPLARDLRAVHAAASSWLPPRRRTVVVSPHPDDETLSSGGLIARQSRTGVDVVVVAVTDGEAAYRSHGDEELAVVRRREQVRALMALADNPVETVSLGLPDGRVGEFAQQLATDLAMVIEPNDLVIVPWLGDHHADHVAVAGATLAAVSDIDVDLKFSLFWAWHRSASDLAAVSNLLRLELTDEERRRKTAALDCHRSQTEPAAPLDPVLNHELTEPARWPSEFFVDGSDR